MLSVTSLLGVGSMVYTTGFMGLRLFDGSYATGGAYVGSLAAHLRPAFDAGKITKKTADTDSFSFRFLFIRMSVA